MANPRSLLLANTGIRVTILGNIALANKPIIPVVIGPTPTPSPTISFTSAADSYPEGNSGTTSFPNTINVTRNGVAGALTILLTYAGTATTGDYAAPTSVTIPSGSNAVSFNGTIIGDTDVEPSETLIITATLDGFSGVTAQRNVTILNDDTAQATGRFIPNRPLADVAVGRTGYSSDSIYLGAASLPAGNWIVMIAAQLPKSNAYDSPLISMYNAPASSTYMNEANYLFLGHMQSTTASSIDPARGEMILSGKDAAGNQLCVQNNRSISSYWGGRGTNVPYISGPHEPTPDGEGQVIFLAKRDGQIQLWTVRKGSLAVLHDYTNTNFGAASFNNVRIGEHPSGVRINAPKFQRYFMAAGSLEPWQMEAVAQGVDPREYIPFDQPSDRLVGWTRTGADQPDIVGTGTSEVRAQSAPLYTVQATPIIPTAAVDQNQPRVFMEANRIVQAGKADLSPMYVWGRVFGTDDDIYLRVVSFADKTQIIVPFAKVARSVNGDWSGNIPDVPAGFAYYDLQIRKGLDGEVITLNKSFEYGHVHDMAGGQSVNEEMFTAGSYSIPSSSAAFGHVSQFSRAKSTAGSTQGVFRRGWSRVNSGGYGVFRFAHALAEMIGRPVGIICSAVKGSGIDAWEAGSQNGFEPMMDTWLRTRPGSSNWAQGQGSTGVSRADYMAFLGRYLAAARSRIDWEHQFMMESLCVNAQSGQASSGGVFTILRKAQRDYYKQLEAAGDTRVSDAGGFVDLATVDGIHPDYTLLGQARIAERLARQVAWKLGKAPTSAEGPVFTTLTRNGATAVLKLQHNGGTGLQTPKAGNITGIDFALEADTGYASKLVQSSALVTGSDEVTVVLNADPGGRIRFRYQDGNPGPSTTPLDSDKMIPAVVNPVYDNRVPFFNTALGFPAVFTSTDLVSAT